MTVHEVLAGNSGTDSSSSKKSVEIFPEAIVADEYVFKHEGKSTFDHTAHTEAYAPIESYEGRHRYDPSFEWEQKEEKKVVRRVRQVFPNTKRPRGRALTSD